MNIFESLAANVHFACRWTYSCKSLYMPFYVASFESSDEAIPPYTWQVIAKCFYPGNNIANVVVYKRK